MVAAASECRDLERHPEKFASFFEMRFPGIIPDLLSAESVTEQFRHHQKISLKSVKCGQFGYGNAAVLLGDSCHTMTPFHAMGMITGLEDVRIFFEEFIDPAHRGQDKGSETAFCPDGVVQRYTAHRRRDVHAMTDMAAEHYHELRIGITSKARRVRSFIESSLKRYAPALNWDTLYSRIHFGHERYSVIRQKEAQQQRAVQFLLPSVLLTGMVGILLLLK